MRGEELSRFAADTNINFLLNKSFDQTFSKSLTPGRAAGGKSFVEERNP